MHSFQRRAAVVSVVGLASIAVAACGSSSSKTSAKAPATPSTPSTTSTTPAGGSLTKAQLQALGQPVKSAQAEFNAVRNSNNPQTIGAAISKFAATAQTYASQVGALKAPSATAATAQQKFVSATKELASVLDQYGKAVSANNLNAAKALQPKLTTLEQEFKTAGAQLKAALQ